MIFLEEPEYFYNDDLTNIITPVNVELLVKLLKDSDYDPSETEFLQNGFSDGFDIGYCGPQDRKSTSENIPFTIGNKVDLWNKLMKEVRLKRVAGPFKEIPFESFIQSPIGLVPKAGSDQTRLILHLSYKFKSDGLESEERCSVKYRDLDFAVRTYLDLLNGWAEENEEETQNMTNHYQAYSAGNGYLMRPMIEEKWQNKFDNQHQQIANATNHR